MSKDTWFYLHSKIVILIGQIKTNYLLEVKDLHSKIVILIENVKSVIECIYKDLHSKIVILIDSMFLGYTLYWKLFTF